MGPFATRAVTWGGTLAGALGAVGARRRPAAPVRDLVVALAGLAAAGVATRAALEGVSRGELALFEVVYGWPDVLEPVLWLPMQLGTVGAPLVVAPVVALITGDLRPAVGVAAAGVAAWWSAKGLKRVVGRGRPGAHVEAFVARWGTPARGTGFPSGHVAVAVAIVASLAPDVGGRASALLWGLAGLVALGRLQVGAHLPLDVIGGTGVGLALAAAGRAVVDAARG